MDSSLEKKKRGAVLPDIIQVSLFSDNGDIGAEPFGGNLCQSTVCLHGEQLLPDCIGELLVSLAESNSVVFRSKLLAQDPESFAAALDVVVCNGYVDDQGIDAADLKIHEAGQVFLEFNERLDGLLELGGSINGAGGRGSRLIAHALPLSDARVV